MTLFLFTYLNHLPSLQIKQFSFKIYVRKDNLKEIFILYTEILLPNYHASESSSQFKRLHSYVFLINFKQLSGMHVPMTKK